MHIVVVGLHLSFLRPTTNFDMCFFEVIVGQLWTRILKKVKKKRKNIDKHF